MSGFTDFLPELFEGFGRVTLRRMFGGHGLYHDGSMIGLVASDVLYLKADDETRELFTARRLGPFRYGREGKMASMSYYEAPSEIFDDPDDAAIWARRAFAAALRAKATRPVRSKRNRQGQRRAPVATETLQPRSAGPRRAARTARRRTT